jgi:AcrR family transcriptional regulator
VKKGEQSKNHLIVCAAKLFWRSGYHATGISEILKEAALPKGSFYFYFKSKKDIAAACITYYEQTVTATLQEFANNTAWDVFIKKIYDFMIDAARDGSHYGCPFAVVGIELAMAEPEIAQHYAAALKRLKNVFTAVIMNSGISEETAVKVADILFTMYEGRLLLFRISGDCQQFEKMRQDLQDIFKLLTTAIGK